MTNPFAGSPAPTQQPADPAAQAAPQGGGFGAATSPQGAVAPQPQDQQGFAPQQPQQGFAPQQGAAPQQGFAPQQGAAPQQGFGAGTPYQAAAAPNTGPAPLADPNDQLALVSAPVGGGFGVARDKGESFPLKGEVGQLVAVRLIRTKYVIPSKGQNAGQQVPALECDYAVFTGPNAGAIRNDQLVFNKSVVYQAMRMIQEGNSVYAGVVQVDPSKNGAVSIAAPTAEQAAMVEEACRGQLGWL